MPRQTLSGGCASSAHTTPAARGLSERAYDIPRIYPRVAIVGRGNDRRGVAVVPVRYTADRSRMDRESNDYYCTADSMPPVGLGGDVSVLVVSSGLP